jgi:hypothetical protein
VYHIYITQKILNFMGKSKNRKNQKSKAAHRAMLNQHAKAKNEKLLKQIQDIQEVLDANPGLEEELRKGQAPTGPAPSTYLTGS